MTMIYKDQNIKLEDLNYGDVFYFCSRYEAAEKILYMKVSNTTRELDECGIVNLKTGYVTREREDATVVKINAAIHVV